MTHQGLVDTMLIVVVPHFLHTYIKKKKYLYLYQSNQQRLRMRDICEWDILRITFKKLKRMNHSMQKS